MARDTLPSIPGFRLLRRVGRGTHGSVYHAIQAQTGRQVALKVFEPVEEPDATLPAQVEHERAASAVLRHRNLARIHAMGEYGPRQWLASEYLPGGSLAECIGKGLSPARALRVFDDLLRGLGHAHARGIVHGDVKPANVLFREPACSGDAVLVDFGSARGLHPGAQGGTPGYMSPEQVRGEPIDARSDLYSLGLLLREMLSGRAPGTAATSGSHRLPVPARWLQPLLDSLLARDPADRPADTGAVLAMLDALLAASPEATALARPPGTSAGVMRIHGVPPTARYATWQVLLFTLGLLVFAGLLWSWLG